MDIKDFVFKVLNRRKLKKHKLCRSDRLLLKRNSIFKNIHKGCRCFILGNGPSLKKIDFALLQNEYVFTVNQLPKDPNFQKLKTNYHFWADSRFFNFDFSNITTGHEELVKTMLAANTIDNKPVVFYDISAKPMIDYFGLRKELDIYYFALVDVYKKAFLENHVYDIRKRVPNFSTVVQTCICVAVYMGFKEIVLLGCDQTSVINIIQSRIESENVTEYAYELSEAEQKRLKTVAKQTSLANELKWQGDVLDTYDYLYEYCKKKGISLLNATEGSLIESIPKIRLEDKLKK